jgi:hypothetical protein
MRAFRSGHHFSARTSASAAANRHAGRTGTGTAFNHNQTQ